MNREVLNELAEQAHEGPAQMSERVCLNMSQFKAVLRQQRKIDDNIILRMNTTDTAKMSECKALFAVLQAAYQRRDRDIEFCLNVLDQKIKQKQEAGTPSFSLQTQYEWVDGERKVESIVKQRSLDVFKARCPFFEIP
ncbi:hypothetical protein IWW36_004405 [Coemansia brasiliensis]|uniref:Uncharacterized protein n=1 Tax=Coemansia brasiliensis TaxID=2650707 RepID=A0A9W8LY26_9FUNG|nr:hypothetical protein IWW36_004405 [Coemansia brasiliensis]